MLLIQTCGLPAFVTITLTGILVAGFACVIASKFKNEAVLAKYLPMTLLPFFMSTWFAMMEIVGNIDLQTAQNADSAFLLTLNLVPLMYGTFVTAICASVTIVWRWSLAWKESGLRLFPKPKPKQQDKPPIEDPRKTAIREAEEYVERLARPK